jgi:hypothetical protein
MMDFETKIFDEPELEFGDKHHYPDPRLGLVEAGPLQPPLGEVIKVGVIGSAKTVEDTKRFLAAVATGFEGKSEKHPNLPGLGNANPFSCRFEIEEGAAIALPQGRIEKIGKEPDHMKAVEMAVEDIVSQLEALNESSHRPDVAIVALPVGLIERVWSAKSTPRARRRRRTAADRMPQISGAC